MERGINKRIQTHSNWFEENIPHYSYCRCNQLQYCCYWYCCRCVYLVQMLTVLNAQMTGRHCNLNKWSEIYFFVSFILLLKSLCWISICLCKEYLQQLLLNHIIEATEQTTRAFNALNWCRKPFTLIALPFFVQTCLKAHNPHWIIYSWKNSSYSFFVRKRCSRHHPWDQTPNIDALSPIAIGNFW